MACASKLWDKANITVFESEMQPGGHTHTVDVTENGEDIPVDTGFMVYNESTYPLLTKLFDDLGVETMETDMSFSVQYRPQALEYSGSDINGLFAQRRNLVNPKFLSMLRDIVRFNRVATRSIGEARLQDQTLEDFVEENRFGKAFLHQYLVPMTSAIWSTPPDGMLRFPAHTLLRFMYNHGLLGITTQHQWRTVKGGSRQYRDKLIAPFKDRIRCSCPVTSVRRNEHGATVRDANGDMHSFDKVILATHADTTLELLENPTELHTEVLSSFPYAANRITLHTDTSVMPDEKRAWASWNYRIDRLDDGRDQASTHYWMNSLQKVSGSKDYIVSVNEAGTVDRDKVLREFNFDHPMFSQRSANAQRLLPELNRDGTLFLCGSYFRYGFHEDGLLSGFSVADRVLNQDSAHHEELVV